VQRLFIHAITFAAVSALLVFAWMLTTGSSEALRAVAEDPSSALDEDFWPILVIAPWATALVIHAAVALSNALRGLGGKRRRERRRRQARKDVAQTAAMAHDMVSDVLGGGRTRHRGRDAPPPVPPVPPQPARAAEPVVGEPTWVAVLFTDIVDSTSLNATLGDAAWHQVLLRHREMVRDTLRDHHGEEVSTQGDGFFLRFDSVGDAVRCAVAIQERMAKARLDDDGLPHLRLGIHAGEVVQDDDGDLMGNVVNLAARVTTAAEVDEILITESVADRTPSGFAIDDKGLRELKGVAQTRHVLSVGWAAP
jgi:class 3 adenylate cyclase